MTTSCANTVPSLASVITRPDSINEGDKIRYLHLKRQNPFACSAFSFATVIPTELDISNYIDLETQFEKSFVEPLRFITEKILWKIDDSYGTQGTLEEFF